MRLSIYRCVVGQVDLVTSLGWVGLGWAGGPGYVVGLGWVGQVDLVTSLGWVGLGWAGGPGYVVGLGCVGLGRWTWLRRWAIPYGPDPPRTGVAAISRTPPSRSVPLAGGGVREKAAPWG